MNDFFIDNLRQLNWLLLALAVGAVMTYGFVRRRRALELFASSGLLTYLAPNVSWVRPIVKGTLTLLALIAIVFALTGPRWGKYYEDVQQRKLELMICLDVSKSMLVEDAGMSRLDRAKDDIKRLLDNLAGASVGLITFAGKAQLTCPLTDDYEFFRMAVDDVGIHSAPLGGTNLAEAIAASRKAFETKTLVDRAVILVTDGEDHGGTAVDEAAAAAEQGIRIFAVGIGDEDRGGLIPVEKDGMRTYLQYEDQQVWSKLNPAQLQAIARAGGGEYQPSRLITPKQRTLEWIYTNKLEPMQKRAETQKHVERYYARSHWFAGLALLLLMVETLLRDRRSKARTDELELNVTREPAHVRN